MIFVRRMSVIEKGDGTQPNECRPLTSKVGQQGVLRGASKMEAVIQGYKHVSCVYGLPRFCVP